MRIVFTSLTYFPNKDGVQMVTQYMAEGLAKLGHDVTVITCLKNNNSTEEVHNGVRIIRFEVKTKLKFDYGQKKEFQEYLISNNDNMDVLITVCANTAFAKWVYPIVDKLSCKKIMYQHGMYDGHLHLDRVHSLERFIKQLLLTPYWEVYHRLHWKRILGYDACVHLFEGDSSHSYFKAHGFQNNYVIMNTCEEAFFEEASEEDLKISQKYGIQNPYFLYVANFCPRKDQKLAVRSFCSMNSRRAELVLVGSKENDYVKELRKLISQMDTEYPNHGRIHLLVGISREDTVSLIKKCYACLMSSNNEYLPITIIEAMACGHPFLSTNVGVVSKLPGGVTVPNVETLTYWLDYYAENPEFVRRMGEIAKIHARDKMFIKDKIKELETICSE